MHGVEVTILGQKYLIKGDAAPEHIEKVAEYVHRELRRVYENNPSITPLRAAILASLNIADELHRTKDYYASVSQSMKTLEDQTDSIIKLFD
ncbi:MAG: cell division protein ZapA [Nitrospiraceae bacterium]|jgi:cell division protein ZapA|nr:cell division protein ZapA [Nitrospiraceae bacterium]